MVISMDMDIPTITLMAMDIPQKNNISYTVIEPNKKEFVIKSYADNFLKD